MISEILSGSIIDIRKKCIFQGTVFISGGRISDIRADKVLYSGIGGSSEREKTGGTAGSGNSGRNDPSLSGNFGRNDLSDLSGIPGPFILPGFLDAHIHIESTMLTPVEYSRAVVGHGIVGSFSDPHEIANVCGIDGIRYMVSNASQTPFPIRFGASPCVPSTPFEHYGSVITPEDIEKLLAPEKEGGFGLRYMSEMMNYPGVISGDPDVLEKIKIALRRGVPVDGHAPGLSGNDLIRYVAAGIGSDHECSSFSEAVEKASLGLMIMIREGTAVKNYDGLKDLISLFPEKCLFCTDDCHPFDLSEGTIQNIVRRAVHDGYDLFDVLRIACVNPVSYFRLDTENDQGLLNIGDRADLIVVSDLSSFDVLKTYIKGECVYDASLKQAGKDPVLIPSVPSALINSFETDIRPPSDFRILYDTGRPEADTLSGTCPDGSAPGKIPVKVINLIPHEIRTEMIVYPLPVRNDEILPDPENDILKVVSVDRYHKKTAERPGLYAGFVRGTGLRSGAVATTISHDCHNIIAAGTSDKLIAKAVNMIIENKGGLCVVSEYGRSEILPLPVAGLMSPETADKVKEKEDSLLRLSREIGMADGISFMNLSFLSLLVIPEIRICPDGLFDVVRFGFTDLKK